MKYVLEFGVRGGAHSDNTILSTQALAQELAGRMVMVLTNRADHPAAAPEAWQFFQGAGRITWKSPTHFVSISKLDGKDRGGAASSYLWKMARAGEEDVSGFTYSAS